MSPTTLRAAPSGFTLIELLVAVAIVAILVGAAAPSLRDFILNVRLTGHANDLLTDLMLARSEAVKRVTSITVCGKRNSGDSVCGTDADWAGGWLMVVDADADGKQDAGTNTQIKQGRPITAPNTLKSTAPGNKGAITFGATGVALSGAATLTLCDRVRPNGYGRVIDVSAQGRASIKKVEPALGNSALCQ